MTLSYGIFDVSDPENPDREYTAALLCSIFAKFIRDGIVYGEDDELAVSVSDPPAMSVVVGLGTAMVQGRFVVNDDDRDLTVTTADATNPRIDRVVVRLNATPGRTVDIVVKAGTPAPSPAAPALTRTAETWELSLAQILVGAGVTAITADKITDERSDASLCGLAVPAYVPSSQLAIVETLDMDSNALTGLPAPSAASDATNKTYVDGLVGAAGNLDEISDEVLLSVNAVYDTDHWDRVDTGKKAVQIVLDAANQHLMVRAVDAGSNPISWDDIALLSSDAMTVGSIMTDAAELIDDTTLTSIIARSDAQQALPYDDAYHEVYSITIPEKYIGTGEFSMSADIRTTNTGVTAYVRFKIDGGVVGSGHTTPPSTNWLTVSASGIKAVAGQTVSVEVNVGYAIGYVANIRIYGYERPVSTPTEWE